MTGASAGEALAHVERRLAVDAGLAREQRDVFARAERDDGVRVERRERRAGDLVLRRADDRQLPRRREVEVERAERPAERRRDPARGSCASSRSTPDRLALELVVAVDPRKPQQHEREHRVPRRHRVVVEVLLARDQLLRVVGGHEEAAALLVGEELDRQPGEPVRLLEPAQLAGRDVELVAGRARRRRSPRGSRGSLARPFRHVRKSRPSGVESSPSRKFPSRSAACNTVVTRQPPPGLRPAPRAPGRSRRRSPCRRGPAAGGASARRAGAPSAPGRARRG